MKSGEFPPEQAIPVCSTPATITAGFELLVALAVGCMRNLRQIVDTLTDMYYSGMNILSDNSLTVEPYSSVGCITVFIVFTLYFPLQVVRHLQNGSTCHQ